MYVTKVTNIGDPQIVLYEGKYYQYATYNDGNVLGICCWVSDDLVNWSDKILCLNAGENHWGYTCFWAPEVVYHNGKFVMTYSAKSRALDSFRIEVAISDSPTGPFIDVHGGPMFDFGYAAIDGSILVCEEGNFLYYSRDCGENIVNGYKTSQIYCIRMNDALTEVVGEPKLVSTPDQEFEMKSAKLDRWEVPHIWNEGPCVIKRGDTYIMNYSTNYYASLDYAIGLSTSKSPWGPFVKSKHNPVISRNEEFFGAGHNAFFTNKDGELMTAFHIQTNPAHPSGDRTTVIAKVEFVEEDGEIKQVLI